MATSGKVSCTRRRERLSQEKESLAYTKKHGKDPPPKKRGRKKKTFNFQQKMPILGSPPPAPVRQSSSVCTRSNSRPTRKSSTIHKRSDSRPTRSNSCLSPTRERSPPSLYVAGPSPPMRPGPSHPWHVRQKELDATILSLKVSQACYKKLWHEMVTENMMLDQNLLRPGYIGRVDGPLEEKPPPLSDNDMTSFVQTCIGNPSEVDNNHL